ASAPVRERARAAVRRRLAALPPSARLLAAVLAVAGDGLPLTLAGRVAEIDGAALGPARDALLSAGLLTPAADRLAHGLVATAIADELPRSERERLHRAAADVLLADGAPADRVAGHLLRTRPTGDSVVSTLLRGAAERAWRQGAPHTAVAYLRRALEERAPGDERARLLALLATCSFDAGLPDSRARLREALRASGDRAERHDVLRRLAALSLVDAGDRELERLLAREQASARDDGERLQLELIALDALVNVPERQPERARRLRALVPVADAALANAPAAASPAALVAGPASGRAGAARPAADTLSQRLLLAHRAWLAVERGSEPAEACARLALAALEGGELRARARRDGAFHLCVRTLLLCDRLDDAAGAITLLEADAEALGSSRLHAAAAWFAAELALRAGKLEAAERQARLVLELLGSRPDAFTRGAVELLLHALTERGRLAEGRELLTEHGLDGDLGDGIGEAGILHARARHALAGGEIVRAHADALAAGRLRIAHGRDNPTWSSWRSTAALALAQLGRRDEAAALAEAELLRAERFGAPAAILIAAHAAAVAEPDDPRRITRCEAALARIGADAANRGATDAIAGADAANPGATDATAGADAANPGAIAAIAGADAANPGATDAIAGADAASGRLARTRLQLELGTTLRTSGQRTAARDSLRAALASADASGAVPLAERARRELVASGLRPRRAQTEGAAALTPRQREVCELAAAGVANRAIAQRLFLSVKTVETHLASSFRKLGVETRGQLGAVLATAPR
ncbi:LuxR C-terminal-related transcriptional regulator, partial [Conexibacter sp. JD483]|uniref:LuxR C-terminal-related transcriptional regulator n=3 Tax=Conexibacter TaxID=191494 RepID=UPI00286FC73A